ncbi:uncharacterized protein LOC123904508 [Trifolium pratense]|uniref:uncharacterized protein LOC123904508 n=1 Tax=Trifolium pratense TaxID=57577 RepID=UPI001E695B3B|nr:uncharacterized protein LOC123904508 [Trifolium pratense]
MLKKSKRVCFSPNDVNEKPTIFLKHGYCSKVLRNRKRLIGTWTFRFRCRDPILSPVRVLMKLGAKVASSIRAVSLRRSSRKVSSSTLVRSHSLSNSNLTDSHRAKAVEDCIEFLHSSSSREVPS